MDRGWAPAQGWSEVDPAAVDDVRRAFLVGRPSLGAEDVRIDVACDREGTTLVRFWTRRPTQG